jgi:hypothetical protein
MLRKQRNIDINHVRLIQIEEAYNDKNLHKTSPQGNNNPRKSIRFLAKVTSE